MLGSGLCHLKCTVHLELVVMEVVDEFHFSFINSLN
uniref:Uncharacterized protein n=1 Tax=Anguilla anguilla TaxID=7936 RepID=A0A0E9PVV8_ANGAN